MYSYFYRKICSRVEEVVNTAYSGIPYPTTERIIRSLVVVCNPSCMAGSRARLRPGGSVGGRPSRALVVDPRCRTRHHCRTATLVVLLSSRWYCVIFRDTGSYMERNEQNQHHLLLVRNQLNDCDLHISIYTN